MNNNSEPTPEKKNRLAQIWRFLTNPHPSIQEIGARRQAQLLASLSLGSILLFGTGLIATILARGNIKAAMSALLPVVAIALIAYGLSRTRYFKAGSWLLVLIIALSAYGQISGGSDPKFALTLNVGTAFLLGSALLSFRAMIILVVGNIIISPIALAEIMPELGMRETISSTAGVITLGLLILIVIAFRNSIERQRIQEVQKVNKELTDITANLEKRVEERTADLSTVTEDARTRSAQLETISEVARAIAQLQDVNKLLPEIAALISERFGYYHVGIFLLDEDGKQAVLRATNSEGGKRMLARGHRLVVGQVGIVGYVAQRGEARIAQDVGVDTVYFENPDLPNTRSEIALPLAVAGRVIGVLDVQSEKAEAFGQANLDVMGILAGQVAVAIENARLFGETKQALSEAQSIYSQFVRQEWNRIIEEERKLGYRYSSRVIEPLDEQYTHPEIHRAIESGGIVKRVENNVPVLAIPLKLRGEVIGVLDIRASDPEHEWKDNELALAQAVADRVALAIENARLLQDAQRRASRERTIFEATSRIGGKASMEAILQATVKELGQMLGGSEVAIEIRTSKGKEG